MMEGIRFVMLRWVPRRQRRQRTLLLFLRFRSIFRCLIMGVG